MIGASGDGLMANHTIITITANLNPSGFVISHVLFAQTVNRENG